jgi:ABC-2 type transport system ATP-binding protein
MPPAADRGRKEHLLMIEAEGLTRYYGNFAALRDATFSIREREIVGFLGLNGAGKSTVLKILAGLLMPSAGKATIGGIDATEAPDAMRKRIGFLPEEPPLYREMRVAEFLRWVGQVKGRTRAQVDGDLPRVMETCQLTDVADKVIAELSHGYRKRVGIAQAIVHQPDVVILDEPISGLDPQQIVEMRSVVRSLKKTATVLISSHILTEIAQTCDRILVIHRGRLVAEGSERELGHALGEGTRLTLVLRGRVVAVEEVLSSSSHVDSYEVAATEDELVQARVTLHGDAREDLVAELVGAGIGVRAVQDAVSELEQIFLELTRQGGNPAASPSKQIPVHVEARA